MDRQQQQLAEATGEKPSKDQEAKTAASGVEDDALSNSSSSSSSSSSGGEEDDDAECERRRLACLADMRELEQLFGRLKEALFKEKQCLIEAKLREIEDESADEFTHTVFKMKQNMEMRIRLATLLRDYKLKNAQHLYEYEEICVKQSLMNDKTALFDRYVAKVESEMVQLEEQRRQLNLNYNIYQLLQAEKALINVEDSAPNTTEELETCSSKKHDDDNMIIDETPESSHQQNQQQQLRKSTRNRSGTTSTTATTTDSSAKTSASSSGIWSDSVSSTISSSNAAAFDSLRAQAIGQLYARQLDPDAAPYIVYNLSEYEILEDCSILNMHKSLNSRLNKV